LPLYTIQNVTKIETAVKASTISLMTKDFVTLFLSHKNSKQSIDTGGKEANVPNNQAYINN
jgi:hypothetical protein